MLIFITVYHDLKNRFRCSLKFSLNLLHTNRHTECVGPMWVLSNSSTLVIVREDASTVQKWFNYAPVTVYIMLHPFEDTRTVFDHVFNYDWMLLKGILS